MGRSQGVKRTRSVTPSPIAKQCFDSPLASKKRFSSSPFAAAPGVLRKGRGARGGQKRDESLGPALGGRHELPPAQELLMYEVSSNDGGDVKFADVISGAREERKHHLARAIDELTAKARDLQSRHQELQRLAKGSEDEFCRLVQRIDSGAQSVGHGTDSQVRHIFAQAKANPKRNDELWAKSDKDKEKEDDPCGGGSDRVDDLETQIDEGVNAAHGLEDLLKDIANRNTTLRFFDFVADGLLRPDR